MNPAALVSKNHRRVRQSWSLNYTFFYKHTFFSAVPHWSASPAPARCDTPLSRLNPHPSFGSSCSKLHGCLISACLYRRTAVKMKKCRVVCVVLVRGSVCVCVCVCVCVRVCFYVYFCIAIHALVLVCVKGSLSMHVRPWLFVHLSHNQPSTIIQYYSFFLKDPQWRATC